MHLPISRRALARALLLGALSAGLLGGCNRPPATLKIGVAQPLSGNLSALGQDMLNGVKLAVDELNKSGFKVKGQAVTLEVMAVDDRANAATGKTVAQQLVDAGVVAVIGHLNSGVSIEAAPIYASQNIPQLAISTKPEFTQLGLATTFRLVANDTLQAKALGSFAASQFNASKFAVLDDGTPYGKGLADGAATQLKNTKKDIVLRQSLGDKTTAFGELAGKLKASGVNAVVTTLNDFQVLALMEALKAVQHTGVAILGGDTIKTTTMLKGGEMLQGGLYATSPILEPSEFPAGARFLEAYRSAFKIEPAYGGHYSHDATHVLAHAIQRAESTQPQAITEARHRADGYEPVIGSMKFDARGEQRYGVISVYLAHKGRWESQVRSDAW